MAGMTRRRAAKCLGDSASQYTIINFHLPPIAASAAVNGQPLTGLGRLRREWLPTGAFLIGSISQIIFRPDNGAHHIVDAARGGLLVIEVRRLQACLPMCGLLLILMPLDGPAQNKSGATGTSPKQAPKARDGQHDFDFHIGTWKTRLTRLVGPLSGSTTWAEYQGTTVVRKVWDGRANLVELVADGPSGHIEALSLRLYNPASRQWNLNFASSQGGTLSQPTIGSFQNGRGEFYDQETYNGRAILVRFVISDITPNSCRFEQAFSDDGGKTWEVNWIAADTRVKDGADKGN